MLVYLNVQQQIERSNCHASRTWYGMVWCDMIWYGRMVIWLSKYRDPAGLWRSILADLKLRISNINWLSQQRRARSPRKLNTVYAYGSWAAAAAAAAGAAAATATATDVGVKVNESRDAITYFSAIPSRRATTGLNHCLICRSRERFLSGCTAYLHIYTH